MVILNKMMKMLVVANKKIYEKYVYSQKEEEIFFLRYS